MVIYSIRVVREVFDYYGQVVVKMMRELEIKEYKHIGFGFDDTGKMTITCRDKYGSLISFEVAVSGMKGDVCSEK